MNQQPGKQISALESPRERLPEGDELQEFADLLTRFFAELIG